MRDDAVELRIVLDLRQIAIVLDSHERVRTKGLSRERVVITRECLGLERRVISREQLLDYVENRGLTGSRRSVQHKELLNILTVPGHNSAYSPFELLALLRLVKGPDEFIPCRNIPLLKVVGKTFASVVLLAHRSVLEREIHVERMTVVGNMTDPATVVKPDLGAEVPKVLTVEVLLCTAQEGSLPVQVFVNETADVVLVGRPQSGLLIPYGIESLPLNHEVPRFDDLEVRDELDIAALRRPLSDSVEVHMPSFQ